MMQALQRLTVVVYLAACLLVADVMQAQSSSCMLNDAELMRQRRLRTLKTNILGQLGLNAADVQNATAPTATPGGEEAIFDTFNALRSASASLTRERERKCHSEDFFAKPVTSFVGIMSPEEVLSNDVARREVGSGSGSQARNNILSNYKIVFDFELPENLSTISRADLLLYQLPVESGSIIRDLRQYVEIRTVIESLGQRFVVEGKYIDIYDGNTTQVFDITSAVKLWVAKDINGSVTLEVIVYCYSSPDCSVPMDGRQPAGVKFLYETRETDKAPRVITVSKNPIELEHQRRFRRTAEGGAGRCVVNQTTCCLKPLTINFADDLGFNFIVQPLEFEANFCEGICPEVSNSELLTPQLFDFLSMLGEGNPASSIEPCCAGNTYRSLEVLMRINGIYVIEELAQVIVTSCRCA